MRNTDNNLDKKIFELDEKRYRLKELDLDMMHSAAPLLIRYRELLYKYTCNIDTTKLDSAEYEVSQIKDAIKECGSTDNELLNRLKFKLKDAQEVLNSNELVKLKKYLSDTEAIALFEMLSDAEFIAGILNGILISIEEKKSHTLTKEELQSKDAIQFIKEVIADFFLLTAMNN